MNGNSPSGPLVGFTLRPLLAAVALAHRPGSPSTRGSSQRTSRTASRRIRRCLGTSALQRLLSTAKDSQICIKHIDMQEEQKGPAFTMNVHTTELPFVRFLSDVLRLHCRVHDKNPTKGRKHIGRWATVHVPARNDPFLCPTCLPTTTVRPLSSVVWPPFAFRRSPFRRSSPSPFARRFI